MISNRTKTCGRLMGAALGALWPGLAWSQVAPSGAGVHEEPASLDEVVVTGSLGRPGLAILPTQVLSGEALAQRRRGTLGETLNGLPGVHMDSYGGGVSRPVIRGQSLPRIEILTDGANLFDASSVSPDHGITTDPLLLDAIEIQRGPAAVRYGGNAVNGAVNLIDSKVPKTLPPGGATGALEARYGAGDEETSVVARLTAGVGPFAFHAEGSRRSSEDYRVNSAFGSGRLRDSFADATTYSVGGSWILPKGYLGAAYTRQTGEYGLPGHNHANAICHIHGADLHCGAHGVITDPLLISDDHHTAEIRLRSERIDVRSDIEQPFAGFRNARMRLSYTDYEHDEVDSGLLFSRYGNEVYDGRIELTHAPVLGFSGTVGLQYTEGTFGGLNQNDRHRDRRPESAYFDLATESYGLFLSESRAFGPVRVDLAVRRDWRKTEMVRPTIIYLLTCCSDALEPTPRRIETYTRYYNELWARAYPDTEHDPLSASIGARWDLNGGYSASLSVAHTERAPSLREQFAFGNNLATSSFEVGLARTTAASSSFPAPQTDVEEVNRSMDLRLQKTGGDLEFDLGVFHQRIDDYIFANLLEEDRATGFVHRYLIYTTVDAHFTGLDGQVSYRLSPEGRITLFGDYVRSGLEDSDDNLPRISPGRLGVRYDWAFGPWTTDVEYYRTFEQDRFASYETRTPGYDMVNATIAYRLDLGASRLVELYARGTNLTDDLIFSHTSFVRDQSPLRGRNIVFGVRHLF